MSIFFTAYCTSLFCQSKPLNFNNTALDEVIKTIEKQSNFVFNYDPSLLKAHFFSGKINPNELTEALTKILYDSPYTFEKDEQTILVYLAPLKTYRICGTIQDASTQESLIAANISAINTYEGTQSNSEGYFDFEITANKNQAITISYLGYNSQTFVVQDLTIGDCPIFNLAIDQDLLGGEIIITDYILDGITQGDQFSAITLDYDLLAKNHSSVEHDILKTIQLLPGINSYDDSAANMQIRGSSPDQNLMLWEGVPLYNVGHIFGMISAINPFSVNQVNIFKGAHHPKFDNRVGGIINISLSDSITNNFHGSFGSTMTEAHVNLDIPIIDNRLKLEIAGRQSIGGLYNSDALQSYIDKVFQFTIIDDQSGGGDFIRTNQILDFHDWNAKLIYEPSTRLRFNAGIYRNQQGFEYTYSFEDDPFLSQDKINVETEIINASADFKITKDWTSSLSIYNSSYSNIYNNIESEAAIITNIDDQINIIEENSIRFSNDIKLSNNWKLNVGYEYNEKEVVLDLDDSTRIERDFLLLKEKVSTHNAFQSISYVSNKLRIDAGNRSSYYQEEKRWVHSPRLNIQYAINDQLKFKADAGIYHQFISQLTNIESDLIKVDNPFWILNSNEASLSQKANKFSAGLVFNNNGWLVDVDAYYNQTSGLSTLNPILGVITRENIFSSGSSKVKGLDVLIKKRWNRFNTWINYSFGIADFDFPEVDDDPFPAPNDIRHNLSIISTYKYKNIQVSLNANYHSGLPYSLPALKFNEEDPEAEPPFLYFLNYDDFNKQRLIPYLRFDLNLAYRFNLNKSRNLKSEISLSLINILNRTNILAREYYLGYDDDTDVYSAPSVERVLLGRTPLAMWRVYW